LGILPSRLVLKISLRVREQGISSSCCSTSRRVHAPGLHLLQLLK
jgi:hypothetical protein